MEALADLPGAWLRGSVPAYALVNAGHILGLGLLVGAIAALDLRLLGAFRTVAVAPLAGMLERVAGAGLILALVTGLLLLSVRPAAYLANPAFLAKLALVAAGVLNAGLLRMSRDWRGLSDGAPVTRRIRLAAAVSLVIWVSAVICGRWIAFAE